MLRCWIILGTIVALGAMSGTARADHFALLAAAPRCADSHWPTLRFAQQDVTRLAELLSHSGYREDKISLLLPEQKDRLRAPSRTRILEELSRVAAAAEETDTILVVLSGHGVERSAAGESTPYFCPADGDPARSETLLSLNDIVAAADTTRAKQIVLVADACRTLKSSQAPSVRGEAPMKLPSRWFVYWSCSAGESAYEDPKLQHGVFPHWVIEGIRGSADSSDDRQITAAELAAFATGRTTRYAQDRLGKPQHPQAIGEGDAIVAELPR